MIFKTFKKFSTLALGVTLLAGLAGCESGAIHVKETQLNRIALPVFMLKRQVPTDDVALVAFERVHDPLKVVQVYIEDNQVFRDGFSFNELNPKIFYSKAPSNPVALRLAARDSASNVIYLSSPCQYLRRALLGESEAGRCVNKYYKEGPVSSSVLDAYMQALDNIRRYHGVDTFVLNGYGSGASVATILASQRMDVEAVRTAASYLDGSEYADRKLNHYYEGGLNPIDYAQSMAHLPQYHFVGEDDKVQALQSYHNYAQAVGPTWCMRHSIIPDADDQDGWVEQWPDLLNLPLNCRANRENGGMEPVVDLTPVPFNPDTLDIMDDMHGRGKK
jgi:hypothetical protein